MSQIADRSLSRQDDRKCNLLSNGWWTMRRSVLCLAVLALVSLGVEADETSPKVKPATKAKAIDKHDVIAQDDFYQFDKVQTVHLRIADEELQRMLAALPERIYGRASFHWRDISIENVAIRFKGNSSSGPTQKHKRSFLVKFDEYEKDQRFLGLSRASFDNGIQFGSLFSETIITEILRDLKIASHRANYAKLFVNDEYQGVYVNVERIDETFMANRLPDAKGLLYKNDEGGPGGNLQLIGDDPAAYEKAFEPETKSSKKKQQQLVDFIKFINQAPDAEFAVKLAEKMGVDEFLKIAAVMLYSGAFDQLTGWQPHNFYMYHDGTQDRWCYMPWDLDVGFCETAFGKIRVLDEWHAAWPIAGQLENPLMQRIVADPTLLRKYRETAKVILEKYFEPERLCGVIDAKYALIKADLEKDPFPHRRVTVPSDRSYDDIVASMKEFVRKRHATAQQQLQNPGEQPKVERRPAGPPQQLVEKMQRLQRRMQEMQRKNQDLAPIQKLMQQFGPLIQQGEFDKAEKLIGEALKLTGEDPQ